MKVNTDDEQRDRVIPGPARRWYSRPRSMITCFLAAAGTVLLFALWHIGPLLHVRFATYEAHEADPKHVVSSLGGPDRGVSRLLEYLGSPWVPTDWKVDASSVLDGYIEYYKPRDAVPALARALRHQDHRVYLTAVEQLMFLGPKSQEALPELAAALTHEDTALRVNVLRTLGRIGPGATECIPALRDCLRDDDTYVRIHAAVALWRIDKDSGREGIGVLVAEVKSGGVCADRAARSLGHIGRSEPVAVARLTSLLQAEKKETRASAALGLGVAGSAASSAVDRLAEISSKDEYSSVRQAAAEALKKIKAAHEKKK